MLVRKARVVKIEAIVRAYLTGEFCFLVLIMILILIRRDIYLCVFLVVGSAWNEYKKKGTVHGIPLPSGLVESQKLPEPLFTPSTKAEIGEHDENISPEQGTSSFTPVTFLSLLLISLSTENVFLSFKF